MAVTREQFNDWVREAEQHARTNPASYRRKVRLFSTLGYLFVFLLLSLITAVLAGLAAAAYFGSTGHVAIIKLALILGLVGWGLVSALWVTFDAPQGRRITREQYPMLFAEVDDLQKKLNTIPIHEVILVPEFNAFVAQTPRLGIFGWHKNTLGLGLDLMMVLTPQEMRSVIAHELGHLSGNHSRFAGRIYRVRKTWSNLYQRFNESPSWGTGIVNRFFNWFVPRFDAYSFALRRQNEYEADAAAAELTSPAVAGQALKKVGLFGRYLDGHYWEQFFAQASHAPEPPRMAYAGLNESLPRLNFQRDGLGRFEAMALEDETGFDDTHPCIRDRLNALGVTEHTIDPATLDLTNTAANAWLGSELPSLIADHDRDWWQNTEAAWRARHETAKEEAEALQQLQSRPRDSLDQMELWRLGALTSRQGEKADTLAILRAYQARYPDDPDASLVIGRFLAEADDPACLAEWARIPRQHGTYVGANAEAAAFLRRHGRDDEAAERQNAAEQRHEELGAAEAERNNLTVDDTLVAPGLSAANKEYLVARLRNVPSLGAAWIAEKQPQHEQQCPIYIIACRRKVLDLSGFTNIDADEALLKKVLAEVTDCEAKDDPMHIFVVSHARLGASALAKKTRKAGVRLV